MKEIPGLEFISVDQGTLSDEALFEWISSRVLTAPLSKVALRKSNKYGLRESHIECFINVVKPVHSSEFVLDSEGLRHGGYYLIIGGMSQSGKALSLYLAKTYQAKIIIVGRSFKGDSFDIFLSQIIQLGGDCLYHQADISDKNSVRKLIYLLKTQLGKLDGVFDSTLVLKDSHIKNMSETKFEKVLKNNVNGSIHLAEVMSEFPGAIIVFFSSSLSLYGCPRQCDYMVGFAFQEALAHYLSSRGYKARVINWGFRNELDASSSQRIAREYHGGQGALPIGAEESLIGVELALKSSSVQIIVSEPSNVSEG